MNKKDTDKIKSDKKIDELINYAKDYYRVIQKDENGRYFSWEHCIDEFYKARKIIKKGKEPNYDYLSLVLAWYLASWGMLRDSFLLAKDYRVHINAIKTLLDEKYFELENLSYENYETYKNLLFGEGNLVDELKKYYNKIREDVYSNKKEKCPKSEISQILITKILLGTYGCTPAYDRFFIKGTKNWKSSDIATGTFNEISLLKLFSFYKNNLKELEDCRKELKTNQGENNYSQMKLLDMIFWQYGYIIDTK